MKHTHLLLFIAITVVVCASCHKSFTKADAGDIPGQWNIIVDSIPEGVGPDSHIDAYLGKAGDYYDFHSDNKLYIMEAGVLSVYPYHIDSDTMLTIILSYQPSDSVAQQYHIYHPATSSLILATGWLYTPGNIIGRAVYLTR